MRRSPVRRRPWRGFRGAAVPVLARRLAILPARQTNGPVPGLPLGRLQKRPPRIPAWLDAFREAAGPALGVVVILDPVRVRVICVFTAFSLVPKNTLMRKCCLIHLKNNSTCQRWRYRSAINSGFKMKLLVRNASRLPVSSLTTTRRIVVG